MSKRLAVKVGEYDKDGETKGEYVNLGVVLSGENGSYILIDPSVSLAGCLAKQNILNHKNKKQIRNSLMVSVFDDSKKQESSSYQQQTKENHRTTEGKEVYDDIPF